MSTTGKASRFRPPLAPDRAAAQDASVSPNRVSAAAPVMSMELTRIESICGRTGVQDLKME